MDGNYFASAGPAGEPVVSVWDRRALPITNAASNAPAPTSQAEGSVLELQNVIDSSAGAHVWSLRFTGFRRGCFGVLSSAGQLRIFETSRCPSGALSTSDGVQDDHLHFTRYVHDLEKPW